MFDAEKVTELKWIDELVESVTGHLRQAEGIALDESVARAYRRDVPKLLAAIAALSSLRDAEPAEWRLERLSPDFRADLVDAARIAITQVWADVPGGVDAATLASNVVMAQEFFWLSRQAPVRDAAEDAETDWEYGVQYASGYGIDECHSREHALAIIGAWGGVGTLLKRTPEAEAGPWLPVPEGNQ